MEKTIRMNERELHRMISESVKRVLNETANEMSLHNRKTGKTFAYSPENTNWPPESEDWKWRYDGDKVDRYMWAMKKESEKTGNTGRNGWPTPEFADIWRGQSYLVELSINIMTFFHDITK